MNDKKHKLLRKLPKVSELLEIPCIKKMLSVYPRALVLKSIREILDQYREKIIEGEEVEELSVEHFSSNLLELLKSKNRSSLRRVINATGVVLHTNLGRAVLSRKVWEELEKNAGGYCNLEVNLLTGKRGSRYEHLTGLLRELTGAEDALVVNNNAAAVLLALTALAKGKEVIVSRGQLVEIGGSFRIPEIMRQSGARLVEVGTTNRTYLEDYKKALSEDTAMILKVHTSNYRVKGFTHETSIKELVELGRNNGIPVMEDLGSGLFVDFQNKDLEGEPIPSDSLRSGANVVCFSGDKLLGGPQAGIILGEKKYIEPMKRHPLNRAVRIDKLTVAALEATLRIYRDHEKKWEKIPTLSMLSVPLDRLEKRARKLQEMLEPLLKNRAQLSVRSDVSEVGGGALPEVKLPTYVVAIKFNDEGASFWADFLRRGEPPVFVRIHSEEVILDVRTLFDEDLSQLVKAFSKISAT